MERISRALLVISSKDGASQRFVGGRFEYRTRPSPTLDSDRVDTIIGDKMRLARAALRKWRLQPPHTPACPALCIATNLTANHNACYSQLSSIGRGESRGNSIQPTKRTGSWRFDINVASLLSSGELTIETYHPPAAISLLTGNPSYNSLRYYQTSCRPHLQSSPRMAARRSQATLHLLNQG